MNNEEIDEKSHKNEKMESILAGIVLLDTAVGLGVGLFVIGGVVPTIICTIIGLLIGFSVYGFIEGVVESEIDKKKAVDSIRAAFAVFGLAVGLLIGFFFIGGVAETIFCSLLGIMIGGAYMLLASAFVPD